MNVNIIWNKTKEYFLPAFLIALIILCSWSFSRLPLITNKSKNNAIFYFWGERGLTNEEYNGSFSSYPIYIREDLERQCALDMHERIQILSSLWNWDYYFYFQKLPDSFWGYFARGHDKKGAFGIILTYSENAHDVDNLIKMYEEWVAKNKNIKSE